MSGLAALFAIGAIWACAQLVQAQIVAQARHANGMTPRAGKKIHIVFRVVRTDWRSR